MQGLERRGLTALAAVLLLSPGPTEAGAQQSSLQFEREPRVVVGGEGSELVNVSDAALLPNGELVVADDVLGVVYRFGPNGELRPPLGGRGEGPGEFILPVSFQVAHDSLFVLDAGNRRITVYDRDASIARTAPVSVPFVPGEALRVDDSTWLVRGVDDFATGTSLGMYRDTVEYYLTSGAFEEPRMLAKSAGVWGAHYESGGRRLVRIAAYSPMVRAATFGTCVYVTSTDQPLVTLVSLNSGLIDTIQYNAKPAVTVDDDLRAHFVDEGLALTVSDPEERARRRPRLIRDLPFVQHLPVSQGIVVDPTGLLWLQAYSPTMYGTTTYLFDPRVPTTDVVELPTSMRLLEVGQDYVIGVTKGEFDEQFVVVYRFAGRPERPATGSQCH